MRRTAFGTRSMIIRYATATVLVVLVALLAGCRGMGTQGFIALSPSQTHELDSSSHVVLDARCINVTMQADYNLWENLQILAPTPKRWKIDMTLQVERVIQGKFTKPSIEVHWLRYPTEQQCESLGIAYRGVWAFTNGMPLRIGFDSSSYRHLQNLKFIVRRE